MSSSALDDLIVVMEFLMSQKTATGEVAEAMDRLHHRAKNKIPVDVRVLPHGDTS